ncbi:MAG: Bax inhibitor-1/YccA family protein, partial [Anaerolinea sp.]|nr:Bax inhibitor-1/YccA family protein [Anaerolinea sp.]
GFSLSLILLVFNLGTIFTAFGTTAILFGIMALVGFTTEMDLTKLGRILFFALIGLVIATVVNMFVGWSTLNFIISVIGVLIFMGLTAYDVQNIKRMAATPEIAGDTQMMAKVAIFGALSLYLNFINIFLFLLQLMGGSSND